MSQTLSLQRSRKLLKEMNYETWIVEKPYSPYTHRREDLFNFADLVAIREDIPGVLAIQACGEDILSHVQKILQGFTDRHGKTIPPNPYVKTWLQAQNRFHLWSWTIRGARGKRKLWKLREVEFVLSNGVVTPQEINHDEKE